MARRSLKPQLNQIRAWVQQGRTDAWIAHQLDVSTGDLREFRRQHDLTPDSEGGSPADLDLRDEIEAEIEAEVEAAGSSEESEDEGEGEEETEAEEGREEAGGAEREKPAGGGRGGGEESDGSEAEGRQRRKRRRGRRGGRGRGKSEFEATFDHGDRDGYGLWLDPAVQDSPVYSESWAGQREVKVRIEADQIVIVRTGSGD